MAESPSGFCKRVESKIHMYIRKILHSYPGQLLHANFSESVKSHRGEPAGRLFANKRKLNKIPKEFPFVLIA